MSGIQLFEGTSGRLLEAPDDGNTYVLTYNPSTRRWEPAVGGGGGGTIDSVFGRLGPDIVAENGDYAASQVSDDSGVGGDDVAESLDLLDAAIGVNASAITALNISGGFVAPAAAANLGATPALDFATNRYIRGILNVDAVPTITMPAGYECWLELQQPAAGGKVVTTWPANVDWTDGLPPTLSTGNNAKDLLKFVSDGTNLRGFAVAMNVS